MSTVWAKKSLKCSVICQVGKQQEEAPFQLTCASVTNLKPDIVIFDNDKKILHIYELTLPVTMNIDQRNTEKTQKYSHLITDITGYNCTVNSFEVSSTGFINKRNKSTLLTLHKFMKQDIKKSTFLSNLNSLAWYGSYKSWLTRDDPTFADPPFLIPHLK